MKKINVLFFGVIILFFVTLLPSCEKNDPVTLAYKKADLIEAQNSRFSNQEELAVEEEKINKLFLKLSDEDKEIYHIELENIIEQRQEMRARGAWM
jgi:hypothetical protein